MGFIKKNSKIQGKIDVCKEVDTTITTRSHLNVKIYL